MALGLEQVFARCRHRAVLLGQATHHVIDRFKLIGMVVHFPFRKLLHIMAGLCLSLGRQGQDVLRPVGGDEIRLHINLMFGTEGGALLLHRLVAFRYPMVPEADSQLPRGPTGTDVNKRQRRSGGCKR